MPEAIEMLREDHQKVKDLFEEFEKAEDADLDQERLGEEMTERKEELQGQKGAGARGKISSAKTARRPALAKTKTGAKKNGKTKYRKSA